MEKNIKNNNLILVLFCSVIFLLIVIIFLSIQTEKNNQENYNYGCAYGCYYGLGKDEVPLNFSFDNIQMSCVFKCVNDYGEWK
jgi:hypothetical protein